MSTKRKKPVLLLISDSKMEVSGGGAQISIKILVEGLSERYDIFTFSPGDSRINENHCNVPGYKTFNLKRIGLKGFLHISFHLFRALRSYRPDIVHLQMSSTMIMFHFLHRLGLVPKGTHIVITDRGVYGKASGITTRSINYLVVKADAIVTTTENNQRNYASLYPHFSRYQSKFHVIPNTAGRTFENTSDSNRIEARKRLGFQEDDFVLGFCGRWSSEKNWPLAEEIAFGCFDLLDNSEIIMIIGTNHYSYREKETDEYIGRIQKRIGSKLHSFVDIPNDDVAGLYEAMDVFVVTSIRESFGRTAIEAMSRNTIVIGTKIDGLPEVIGDDQYLYGNAEDALAIIQRIHDEQSFSESSREYFTSRYRNLYGTKRNLEEHDNLYQRILNNDS